MKPQPANSTRNLPNNIRGRQVPFTPFLQMESGHPEERIIYTIIAMEIVYFVEKIMLGLTTCGGNAERSTDTQISVISNSCKSDTKSTTNLSGSGMQE
eukprot:11963466-Heterocapsa_arctica.AAC.1